jgi:hypothetical protein
MIQGTQQVDTSASWDAIADLVANSGPPLVPSDIDVAMIARLIAGRDEDVLLLGVTPQLAPLGLRITGVDKSARMIEQLWPGDNARRRAFLANWLSLPFEAGRFSAVIGDASLNALDGDMRLLGAEIKRVVAPAGAAVFRTALTPDSTDDLDLVRCDVESGCRDNFRVIKWRIGMVLADQTAQGDVAVARIRDAFNEIFPDRNRLCAMTGWNPTEVATIDRYSGARHNFKFPTMRVLIDLLSPAFPSITFVPAQGYAFSERFHFCVLKAEP